MFSALLEVTDSNQESIQQGDNDFAAREGELS